MKAAKQTFGWAVLIGLGLTWTALATKAKEPGQEDKAPWRSLYNGKDLTGWAYKDGEPLTGKSKSTDGRYTAQGDIIRVNDGKGLRQLWTQESIPGDFELRLEFRAGVNADSGLFLRQPQLQVRDYLVAGPYKKLKNYKPQDWNEIVVVVKDQVAHCTCNGEVLEARLKLPKTGPIGLEADRGVLEYKNIRWRPLEPGR